MLGQGEVGLLVVSFLNMLQKCDYKSIGCGKKWTHYLCTFLLSM